MAEIVNSYSNGSEIKVVYSYSQDINSNTTTITATLYVHRDGYGPSWANGSNVCTAYINVEGNRIMTYTASFNIGSSWVKIGDTVSTTVYNNADGTKVSNILGYFDASGTTSKLAGLQVSQNITFPTIPRASTIASAPGNYPIFDSMYIAVNRASSSFTHQMDIYFSNTNGNWTKVVVNANGHFGTDTTYYFTDDQFNTILSRIPAGTGGYYMIDLWTYAADNSVVGTKQYVFNCYCADASQPSINTYPNSTPDFNIGDSITVHMNQQRGDYSHTVTAGFGSWSGTLGTGVKYNVGWNTANNAGSLYSQIPNSNVGTGGVTVYTYRGGVYVGSKGATFYAHVVNSNPTVSSVSYVDTNTNTTNLTGNNQNIVQNQSNVQVTVNGANAYNYASISSYRVQYGGKVVTSSSNVINLGTVPDNNSIVVTVYDTRGNTVQASKGVTYTSYYSPVISSAIAKRNNDIDAASTLTFNGYVAPITVNNKAFSYCYKASTDASYGGWIGVTPTYSGNNFSFSGSIGSYDINKSYNIQVKAADYFTATISTILLPTAQPEISIRNNQIGINKIPENGALDVNGDINTNGKLNGSYLPGTRGTTQGGKWPMITNIGGDGVMEVGKHIDFHETSEDTNDFSSRLSCSGNTLVASGNIKANGTQFISRNVTGETQMLSFQNNGNQQSAFYSYPNGDIILHLYNPATGYSWKTAYTFGINGVFGGEASSAQSLRGMNFTYAGQGGQPYWLLGSSDDKNIYVWNPSNFNVDRVDGQHVASGSVWFNYPTVNATQSIHISFSGFSSPPSVTVSCNSGSPGWVFATIGNLTSTGCDIFFRRTDGAYGTSVEWQAIGT